MLETMKNHLHHSQRSRGSTTVCVVLSAALLGASASAWAGALAAPSVGDGRSSPERIAPSAVYWNPGALGMIDRPRLVGGANLIVGSVRYQRDYRGVYQRPDSFDFQVPISPADVDPQKSGLQPKSNHVVLGPQPDLFAAIPIGNTGLVAGLGFYAPYVAMVNYPEDGAQRFHIQDALIAAFQINPSLAYRITDYLSIGAGVSAVVGYAQLNRVTDFAGLDLLGDAIDGPPVHQNNDFGTKAPTAVRELDVLGRPTSLQQMFALGYTFNVGAMFKWDPVRIGVSYNHSTAMNYRGKFRLDMNNDFFTGDLASQGLQYDPTIRGDASLSFTLPNSIHAGVGVDISPFVSVAVAFSYVMWSTVKAFDVVLRSPQLAQPALGLPTSAEVSLPRLWQNSMNFDAFVDLRIHPRTQLYGNLGFHQNSVPDSTIDASSPDGDRIVIGGGLFHDFQTRFDLTLDAKVHHTLPRTVTASDHDLGNGKYGLTLISLGAHIGIKLDSKEALARYDAADHGQVSRNDILADAPSEPGPSTVNAIDETESPNDALLDE